MRSTDANIETWGGCIAAEGWGGIKSDGGSAGIGDGGSGI